MSFILSVIFVSTSDLFISVVFGVLVVVVVFVTLYPFAVKAFFTFVKVAVESEPFSISIFIFPASVLLIWLLDVLLVDVLLELVLFVDVFVVFEFVVFFLFVDISDVFFSLQLINYLF